MPANLSPVRRRIVFALLFEGIGLAISTLGLMLFSGDSAATAGGAAAGATLIALLYNFAFNAGFEAWEARQPLRGRSLQRRLVHGALFELGLMLLLVPFLSWWLNVGLLEALIYDAGLLIFFAVYTMAFTWAFDRVFGLPASAR
jgi:uncharacterized membrane protein